MKRLVLIVSVLLMPLLMSAQSDNVLTISGFVVDEDGNPIVGASIYSKDTYTGTITGDDGEWSLVLDKDEMLVIGCLGYEDYSVKASSVQKGQKIILKNSATALEDIVVIGYGTRKKENLTGAISSIAGDSKLQSTTSTSFAQNLAGKIAGLQIRQEDGEPGSFTTSINIRGFGAPLYVIDGIPQTDGGAYFQRLNANDIESISVIKDATGAVYGRKGGNGVVIVTTKQGRNEQVSIGFDATVGMLQPTDMPEMCNRSQWAQLYNEAKIAAGTPAYTKEELADEMAGKSTDWYGLTMKNVAVQQKYYLNASGAFDGGKTRYYVGMGYQREDGLLRSGDLNYDKYTIRSTINSQLTKNLKMDINLYGLSDTKNSPVMGYYTAFYAARTALPGSPAYANDNPDYLNNQQYLNPLAIAESDISGYSKVENKNFNATLNLTYDFPFLKGLSAKIGANYDYTMVEGKALSKAYDLYTYSEGLDDPYIKTTKNSPSTISNSYNRTNNFTFQAHLMYERKFADKHNVGATLVFESSEYHNRISGLQREYTFYTGDQIDLAEKNNMTNNGMENDITNMSLIGRVNYDYKGKYLLDMAFRYDGSCLYSPTMRWGFFPVGSIAWRISEEEFMKGQNIVSNLKIRGSYGLTGEDNGLPFQYVQGFSLVGGKGYEFEDGKWTEGAASPTLVNDKLTWFSSTIADVGVDLGFFDNSLNLTFDWYRRDRRGLLATRLLSLPNTFGASLPQENLNSDRTEGFDMEIGYFGKIGEFHYNISGNLNYARTKNMHVEEATFTSSMQRYREALSNRYSDVVWGYVVEGQFQSEEEIATAPIQSGITGNSKVLPGDYRYKDLDGNGIIDSNDMMPLFYSSYPKLFYGLTIGGNYKGFDFSLLFQGAANYTVRFKEVYAEVLAFELNTPAYFYDRWHRVDPYDENSAWIPGEWPATRAITDAGANYNESRIWRRDASYIRLKNVALGYTFTSTRLAKANIQSIRLYFNGNNLLTICDPFVKAFDPEKAVGANSLGFNYPLMRSFNFGVNIIF